MGEDDGEKKGGRGEPILPPEAKTTTPRLTITTMADHQARGQAALAIEINRPKTARYDALRGLVRLISQEIDGLEKAELEALTFRGKAEEIVKLGAAADMGAKAAAEETAQSIGLDMVGHLLNVSALAGVLGGTSKNMIDQMMAQVAAPNRINRRKP